MPSLLTCSAADTTSVRSTVSSFERALGDGSEWMEDTLQWLHTSVKHEGFYCNKPKCSKSSQDQNLRETWLTTQTGILPHAVFLIRLRATSHELGWPGWPGYRDQFRFGFLEEISARVSEIRNGQRSLKRVLARNSRSKTNVAKHKSYNFRTYHSFDNSYSCITAVKWDAYDVYNTAGNARRCYQVRQKSSRFVHVFIWQNVQPFSQYPGWKNRGLRNQASPPSHMNTTKILQRIQR